jgi:hypothetical protein
VQTLRARAMEQQLYETTQQRLTNALSMAEHAVFRLARLDRVISHVAQEDSMLDAQLRAVQDIVAIGVATRIRDYLG